TDLHVSPAHVTIREGRSARLRIRATAPRESAGVLELTPAGGQPLRIPWLVAPAPPPGRLLPHAAFDQTAFAPSDDAPAVLAVQAGRVFVGLLARERDLLPGTYQFGVTGRSPTGSKLAPGRYEVRLVAWPAGG